MWVRYEFNGRKLYRYKIHGNIYMGKWVNTFGELPLPDIPTSDRNSIVMIYRGPFLIQSPVFCTDASSAAAVWASGLGEHLRNERIPIPLSASAR